MEENATETESKIRMIAGPLLIVLSTLGYLNLFGLSFGVSTILLGVGVAMLIVGVTRKCFIYKLLGINRRKRETSPTKASESRT